MAAREGVGPACQRERERGGGGPRAVGTAPGPCAGPRRGVGAGVLCCGWEAWALAWPPGLSPFFFFFNSFSKKF